jgi:hypothetical protein
MIQHSFLDKTLPNSVYKRRWVRYDMFNNATSKANNHIESPETVLFAISRM